MHCNACNRECGLSRFCSPECEAQPRLWPYCQVCGVLIVKANNRDRRWHSLKCKWRGHWLLFGKPGRKKVALSQDAYVALVQYAEAEGVSYSRAVMRLVGGEEREEGDEEERQGRLVE